MSTANSTTHSEAIKSNLFWFTNVFCLYNVRNIDDIATIDFDLVGWEGDDEGI